MKKVAELLKHNYINLVSGSSRASFPIYTYKIREFPRSSRPDSQPGHD